jgi:hypothetical protein
MVVLARVLGSVDLGIVGMVTALTGFLELFRDMGLINLSAQPLVRLAFGNVIFFRVYTFLLCFVMGPKNLYVDLLREMGIWPLTKMGGRRQPLQRPGA